MAFSLPSLNFRSKNTQFAIGTIVLVGLGIILTQTEVLDSGDPSNGLFPLSIGTTWVYEVQTEMNDPDIEKTLTLSVDRKISFAGDTAWIRRSADGAEYYIRRDKSGIYRIASRTDLEEQATMDPEPRYILKTPLQVGDTWNGGFTVPYLIRRPNEFPRDLKHSHKALMTYKVEALNQDVEVPYGTYTGCAYVVGEAAVRIFTDPINGFNDVPLISREWYCPKVGLVKFEREEIVPGQFMTGGKVTYLLNDMR